jgi:hypothetical protein
MKQWDKIRKQAETLPGSDLPRLMFQGLIESLAELMVESACEIECLRNVAQSVTHPSLVKALNDLHVWLEIEGCGDQVEIIDDAFSAAGITEYRCANCDGAGEWDEGPLPATSSTQISPDYRHMVCSDCEGKGTISLSSAHRNQATG